MKNGWLMLGALNLWGTYITAMELSPRSQERFHTETNESKKIAALLDRIESEASYANPYAVARIEAASKELFAFADTGAISAAWRKSRVILIATTHYRNSCLVVNKHKNTIFESSALLLYQQAHAIFWAIAQLHEKIETLTAR